MLLVSGNDFINPHAHLGVKMPKMCKIVEILQNIVAFNNHKARSIPIFLRSFVSLFKIFLKFSNNYCTIVPLPTKSFVGEKDTRIHTNRLLGDFHPQVANCGTNGEWR